MPEFDLRGIRAAKYTNTSGTVSYSNHASVGKAMTANLELQFAEGRLYAESALSVFRRKMTGGSISLAVDALPAAVQTLLFGAQSSSRTVGTATVSGIKYSPKDVSGYVGVAFYAVDAVGDSDKYTCVFVPKALFGPPSMSFQTLGQNLTFNTPTTTGAFMPDDTTGRLAIETATVDTETEAINWCKVVLGETVT